MWCMWPPAIFQKMPKLVIVHKGMSKLVLSKAPNGVILAFNQFLNDPIFDKVVAAFVAKEVITSNVG